MMLKKEINNILPKELSEKCGCPLKPEHVEAEHDSCCQICGGSHVERICSERKEASKIIIDPETLTAIRLQIAYAICAKHQNVFRKMFSDKAYVMTENEEIAKETLKGIIEAEPSIKPKLAVYFK